MALFYFNTTSAVNASSNFATKAANATLRTAKASAKIASNAMTVFTVVNKLSATHSGYIKTIGLSKSIVSRGSNALLNLVYALPPQQQPSTPASDVIKRVLDRSFVCLPEEEPSLLDSIQISAFEGLMLVRSVAKEYANSAYEAAVTSYSAALATTGEYLATANQKAQDFSDYTANAANQCFTDETIDTAYPYVLAAVAVAVATIGVSYKLYSYANAKADDLKLRDFADEGLKSNLPDAQMDEVLARQLEIEEQIKADIIDQQMSLDLIYAMQLADEEVRPAKKFTQV